MAKPKSPGGRRPRKRERKNVGYGVAHIKSSFNNTIISFTDQDGNVLGRFRATGIIPKFNERLQQRGIKLPLEVFDPDRDESWEEN